MRHAIAFAIVFAIVFAALTTTGTGAQAQKVYKCGNTYSQTPCGDGKTLDTTAPDTSTDITRKQTVDKENKRQLAAAKALEKERLALKLRLESATLWRPRPWSKRKPVRQKAQAKTA